MDTDQLCLALPQVADTADADVDLELLKSVPKRFCIDSENAANWLVRKVVAARNYGVAVKAYSEKELRRASREEEVLLFLFSRQAEEWARVEIERLGGRRKSIILPAGSMCLRHEKTKLIVDDEQAVIAWARSRVPQAIQTAEKLLKSVLNIYFESTGELPEAGAHLEREREKFSIR
jgi:hypothetical protein